MKSSACSGFLLCICLVFVAAATPAWSTPPILTEQVKLQASDGTPRDLFGFSVALSGDTAVVGAPLQDAPQGQEAGSAYVFVRSGSSWQEQARLIPADADFFSTYGEVVAISGDTVLVGGMHRTYVFVRTGSAWTEQARLVTPEGTPLGGAVAISADTAVAADTFNGRVHVFVRSGSVWSEQARFDKFRGPLALSGDTLLLGASGADDRAGAVYVFTRSGSTWSQQAKLVSSDRQPDEGFGTSVAISGDTVAVGTNPQAGIQGAVYTFVRSGSTWTQEAELNGSYEQHLGFSIALSGDLLVAGAPAASDPGTALVFVRRGSTWFEHLVLRSSEEEPEDSFGRSVALSETIAVVGMMGSNPENPGAAYVFSLDGVTVTPTTGLLTTEDGGTASFIATVNTLPAGDVVIDLASADPDEGTVSPDRLTFTPDDWWTPQTVTLTGVEDFVDDHGRPYLVTLTMNTELTGDPIYDGIDPPDVSAVNLPFAGDFYTVAPCRLLDTRLPDQEPALSSGVLRTVAVHEACGVPATARAVALNLTVVDAESSGHLTVYPGDLAAPAFSTFSFAAGRNQACHALVLLETGGAGTVTVSPFLAGGGTAQLVLDVSGYFE